MLRDTQPGVERPELHEKLAGLRERWGRGLVQPSQRIGVDYARNRELECEWRQVGLQDLGPIALE
jgi:hypothetical protein